MSKTTIFVSRSRSIKFLPPGALQTLDRIIAQGITILVGDCVGVHLLIRATSAKGYRQVTVTSTRFLDTTLALTPRKFQERARPTKTLTWHEPPISAWLSGT